MDKKTFISELEQALSVLQEEELQDIMEEYEQHIDMKVQNGLTEEEAIADFGNLKDLTSEILEAYHVRGDYASVREETGKSRFSSIRAGKANPGEGVKRGPDIRKAGADFRNFCVSQGKKAGACFRNFSGKETGDKNGGEEVPENEDIRLENASGAGSVSAGRRPAGIWRTFCRCVRQVKDFTVSWLKRGWRMTGRLLRAGWQLALGRFALVHRTWHPDCRCLFPDCMELRLDFLCCIVRGRGHRNSFWTGDAGGAAGSGISSGGSYPGAFRIEYKSVFCSGTGTEFHLEKEKNRNFSENGRKRKGGRSVRGLRLWRGGRACVRYRRFFWEAFWQAF